MKKDPACVPLFGISYVEKSILACTGIHVLNNKCSHAGENTISSRKVFTSCWADGFQICWS